MRTICLIEDEADLNNILTLYLENNNWKVISCKNSSEAHIQLTTSIDLWILDIMLPDGNGFDILSEIKKADPTKPVILISARGDQIDRVLGFEFGCDDYIAKPILPKELVYRVSKLFEKTTNGNAKILVTCGPYTINKSHRLVMEEDALIPLTSREYDLLLYFVKNKRLALSREQVLRDVWEDDFYGSNRVVDNYIKNIRKKLPRIDIETIYGYGYRCNI